LGKDCRIFLGSFPSEVRPEQVSDEALNLFKKYCNNDYLIIGAQSGSQRILNSIGRGHKVEDIYRAAKISVENGFKTSLDFMFGLPRENRKDREKTFEVIEDLIRAGGYVHGYIFAPLPVTPFAEESPEKLNGSDRKRLKKLEAAKKLYGNWGNHVV